MAPENCNDCPMEGRISNLERRVEKNESKSSETHKEFFNRIRELEKNAAVRAEQYDTILDKLEGLTASVGSVAKSIAEIQAEPGQEWKDLKSKATWGVAGAVIAALVNGLLHAAGLL